MSFELDINRFVKKAKDKSELAVRKISIELFTRIADKSPVRTGRFRGNWFPAIGVYSAEATEDVAGDSTARINAVVTQYKIGDQFITLSNNLDYARRLEYGYSKQAPHGMVRISMMEISSKYA